MAHETGITNPEDEKLVVIFSVITALVLLCTAAYFFQSGFDNENARWAQVRSIVEERSLAIDRYAYRSADTVKFAGHYYPNKAPVLSLFSVPAWWLWSKIIPTFVEDPDLAYHAICHLTAVTTVGIASALTAILIGLLSYWMFLSVYGSILALVGWAFGSIALPFSTLYFSHQLAAFLCTFGFFAVSLASGRSFGHQKSSLPLHSKLTTYRKTWSAIAGLCLALAIGTEYPTAIIAGICGIYALRTLDKNAVVIMVLSGLLGLLPLLAYNYAAFGSAFFIPYSVHARDGAAFKEHAQGLMGVTLPSIRTFLEITFVPRRGLFIANPWLILLLPAFLYFFICRTIRSRELWCCISIITCFIIFNSGYGNSLVYWGGGASVGPRHLLPALPFATLLITPLFRIAPWRWIYFPLLALSVIIMLMATATEPRVPYEYANPVVELFLKGYLKGQLALHHAGPFSNTLITTNSVAFNLGKLFGLPATLQLIPLIGLWLSAFITLLVIYSRHRLTTLTTLICTATISIVFCSAPWVYQSLNQPVAGEKGFVGQCYRGLPWSGPKTVYLPTQSKPHELCGVRVDGVISIDWHKVGLPVPGPFAFEWRGLLLITEAGDYQFATESDDGSALYINDKRVVENWGEHAMQQRRGQIFLEAGEHQIVLRYYNKAHGALINLLWSRQGEALRLLTDEYIKQPGS